MSGTVIGRGRTLRAFLIILGLLAAMAAPLTEEPAWAAPPSLCPRNAKGYVQLANRAAMCVITQQYVTVPLSGAVRMAAAAAVDDSHRRRNTASRYFLQAKLYCYDSAGDMVFRIGASRNVWTGIGRAGVYPRSVFTAEPGQYLCTVQGRQFAVGRSSVPRNWYITPRNRGLSNAPFSYRGGTSSGPDMGPWPPARANLTSASGTVTTASKAFDLPLGLSSYHATSTTPLSVCSFSGDMSRGRMCSSINPRQPLVAKVRLYARQQTSPVDLSPCGPALVVDRTQRVDAITHHHGVVLEGTLHRSLACTGKFEVTNQVRILSGRGYLGSGEANSTRRYGWDIAVGAGW